MIIDFIYKYKWLINIDLDVYKFIEVRDVYYKFVLDEVIIVNLEEIIEGETIFVWNGGVDQI